MRCSDCQGLRIAFILLSGDLTPKKVQEEENELAYCFDCKKIVEIKMKIQTVTR